LPEKPSKSVSGDDTPAPVKKAAPVKVTTLNSTSKPSTTSSTDDDGGSAAPSRKPPKRVARAESGTASDAYDPGSGSVASSGGTGYVAVLASIPHSSSSRINALKRYADMQQKYSSALSGKTPDIASANLGAKGQYDRLIVGPPGSRQEASSVCAELKAQGYSSCWVTSY
jgi:cell division septation protein DedD